MAFRHDLLGDRNQFAFTAGGAGRFCKPFYLSGAHHVLMSRFYTLYIFFVIIVLGNRNSIEIARIYAATNAIGKGVGKTLMQKCIEIAQEKKKDVLWLGVWEKNNRAIDFYIKWGFEKFSTHIFMLGDDPQTDWLMKKEL